jgi:lipoyl(octanoyl) transferase
MLKIKQLKGRINYVEALNKMNSKVLEVSEDIKNEEIWFLEHQSVFTAGSSTPKNFNQKKINNIPVVFINRGGKITFHGPGQVIIYPILNIRKRKLNIIEYINKIEEIIIKVFKNNKITLFAKKETNRGLWTRDKKNKKDKKIIFIGLRYSKGVIYHGISINLDLSLDDFRKINPCGLEADQISSLKELNINYNKKELINDLKMEFISQFHLNSN